MDNWSRRLGKIRYPREWIEHRPFELMNALQEFIVLDARYDYASDSVEATGLHPAFAEVGEGGTALYYDLFVAKKPDGDFIIGVGCPPTISDLRE